MVTKKIKWVNVIKLFLFLFFGGLVLHDVYMLTLYSLITGQYWSWSWNGLATFMIAFMTAYVIFGDFKNQMKKMSTTSNSQHLK